MSKWIAEFELEDGDTMPEHMDLNYMGTKIDFHCRPMWIPVSEKLPKHSLISRQAAIDVLEKILPANPLKSEYTQGITCGAALAIEYVKQLPSAQPEIIRCKNCKYAVNVGTSDMMCNKSETWVVATDNDFGCVLAERREE